MPAFVPSDAQLSLVDWVHAHPECHSIHELCAKSGTPRSTYYHWCAHEGFRAWFTAAWSSRLLMDGVFLINQARCNSAKNFRYWKALYDLTFEPKGLGMLLGWQQAATEYPDIDPQFEPPPGSQPQPTSPADAQAQPAAAPQTDAAPAVENQPCPTPEPPPAQQNQALAATLLDKSCKNTTPRRNIRLIQKALQEIAAQTPPPGADCALGAAGPG